MRWQVCFGRVFGCFLGFRCSFLTDFKGLQEFWPSLPLPIGLHSPHRCHLSTRRRGPDSLYAGRAVCQPFAGKFPASPCVIWRRGSRFKSGRPDAGRDPRSFGSKTVASRLARGAPACRLQTRAEYGFNSFSHFWDRVFRAVDRLPSFAHPSERLWILAHLGGLGR